MEEAIDFAASADLFVVIGTPLQVYPAAGLVDSVPDNAPKFLIDLEAPPVAHIRNLHVIEMKASAGMARLCALLNA
jgi:NAD-dependent deacetylase